jgi:SSS family solute:Na+ symporter
VAGAHDMAHLDEWGLGGRSFGGWITWFLVGGDLYTAYTFVAVPALMFGAGAAGFFAVPYTVIIYPLFFLILIRLWSVSHRHGFVTPADFVRGRFGSPTARAAGRDHRHRRDHAVHRAAAGRHRGGAQDDGRHRRQRLAGHLPIIIAFAILAAYTYQSGLRAPALIAFVKDT